MGESAEIRNRPHHVQLPLRPQPCASIPSSKLVNDQRCSKIQAVSPDATIAIVFGLIGAIMSFVGVLIAYLTLRSMAKRNRTLSILIIYASFPSSS
jgi:hypothetical protein